MANSPNVMSADGPLKCLADVLKEGKADLARFSVTDGNTQTPISCEVAVAFDNMTDNEVKYEMEQSTHIMVSGALRGLKKITDVTWEKVEAMLTKNVVCSPNTGYDVMKSERYMKSGDKSKFLVEGKPSAAIQRNIKSWLTRTVNDRNVMNELDFNTEVLGRVIVAASGCIDWLSNLLGNDDEFYKEKTLIDLGVLRFPDDVNEFFQLYHFELRAYIDATREVFDSADKNGFYLTYRSKRFIPREAVIDQLSSEIKTKVVAESVALYTSKPKKEKKVVPKRRELAWPDVYSAEGKIPSVMSVIEHAMPEFKKFDMAVEGQIPLKCDMAVAFDDLTKKDIKQMGNFSLVMVAGVVRTLKKEIGPTYETLKSTLANLTILQPCGSVIHSEIISKTYTDGNFPDAQSHDDVKRELKLWFKKLISDSEVMEDLQDLICMKTLVDCLVTAGKHLSLIGKVKGEHEYNSRPLIDLCVLRFPDNTREYFQLYQIEMVAFTDCTRETIEEIDKCGLRGDFQEIKFKPREGVLDEISKNIVDRASNEALVFYGAKM